MQNYRRIYVLGSGFSKSFLPSLPTLRDLNSYIPGKIPAEFPHLREYCENFLAICNGQDEYLNIETLATAILSTQIFPGEKERLYHENLRFELLRFIASVIRREDPLEPSAAEVLGRFIKACANDCGDARRETLLLSFNYDTLIERAIAMNPELSSKISVDYGVHIEPADRSAKKTNCEQTIDLIKLHGSLNWFPLKGVSDELDLKNVCQVETTDRSFPIYEEDTPIFIPMAHAKESFLRGSLFNLLWAKADYYLKNAEEIHFLGYGFPKTDINNLEFLLKHRDRIANVVVFENEDHPDLKRLRRLLGKCVISRDAKDYLSRVF